MADKRFIGNGSGIVVGTGKDTEFGVIFSMMQDVEEKRTPLQLDMDNLAKQLSIVSFIVIGFIVLIGVIQKRDWLEMFTIGGESPIYTHTPRRKLNLHPSVTRRCCHSRGSPHRHHRHTRPRCLENVKTQSDRQKIA